MQMNKLKIYQWATWCLLLLNLVMLCFFILTKPKHPNNINFNNAVKQEMNLNEEQEKLFLISAKKHIEQMAIISDRQQALWQSYFKSLSSADTLIKNDNIITELQNLETQKIAITTTHFTEIKSFLKPPQYKGFLVFQQRMLERNFKKDKNMPPPSKDF
jgi:periplasmic protein CpxP/Spy